MEDKKLESFLENYYGGAPGSFDAEGLKHHLAAVENECRRCLEQSKDRPDDPSSSPFFQGSWTGKLSLIRDLRDKFGL